MSEYTPDSWVLLKLTHPDREEPMYKVLAGWSGSYLYGDSWKINSGITEIVKDGESYLYYGHSGSVYVCREFGYGLSRITQSIFASINKQPVDAPGFTVEMLTKEQAFALSLK